VAFAAREAMRVQAARTFNARFRIETMVSALTTLLETRGGHHDEAEKTTLPTFRKATQQAR